MRGTDRKPSQLFSYVSLEERVPRKHPLRLMRKFTDRILAELSPQFEAIYAKQGRPSIPPEQLLRALLLQVLYSIRSERLLEGEIAELGGELPGREAEQQDPRLQDGSGRSVGAKGAG